MERFPRRPADHRRLEEFAALKKFAHSKNWEGTRPQAWPSIWENFLATDPLVWFTDQWSSCHAERGLPGQAGSDIALGMTVSGVVPRTVKPSSSAAFKSGAIFFQCVATATEMNHLPAKIQNTRGCVCSAQSPRMNIRDEIAIRVGVRGARLICHIGR